MSRGAGEALSRAAGDLYRQSWRLVPPNAALGVLGIAILRGSGSWTLVLAGLLLLGPAAAALMHCAVTLARGGDLRLSTALAGLRLHWRPGLQVAMLGTLLVAPGMRATAFYAGSGGLAGLVLACTAAYLLCAGGLVLALLLAVRIAEPRRAFRACAARALALLAQRPGAACLVCIALLLVNLAGIAAAVMPFLTFTIAYSFLVIAHFALPEEAPA